MKIFVVQSIFVDEINNNTSLNEAEVFADKAAAIARKDELIAEVTNDNQVDRIDEESTYATVYFADDTWYEVVVQETEIA